MPVSSSDPTLIAYKHLSVTKTDDVLQVRLPRLQTREHYYAVVRELGDLHKMIDQAEHWVVDVSHLRYVPHLIADILIEFARRRRESQYHFNILGLQSDRLSSTYMNELLPHIRDSEDSTVSGV